MTFNKTAERKQPPQRRVRLLGVCARDGCSNRRKIPANTLKGVNIADYETDPYCSRVCCQIAEGVPETDPGGYGIDYGAKQRRQREKAE